MLIAGMYEFSGEYARTVGLPSKSGVGGGITVSVPGKWESEFTALPWISMEIP